jgi:hypothetical protein
MATPTMIEEIIKSAKEQVADRLASPILGSFIISWGLWNYKFIVILFSDATVTKTFQLIDTVAFPTTWSYLLQGILFPVMSAAAYIFVYPYPAKHVYAFTRRRQKEIIELRREIEDETPLTIEESRTIRAELIQATDKHKEEVDRLNAELTRTREQLESLRLTSEPKAMHAIPIQGSVISESQFGLMNVLDFLNGEATLDTLLSKSGSPKTKTEFDLGELVRLRLLEIQHRDYEAKYVFTQEGRRRFLGEKKV